MSAATIMRNPWFWGAIALLGMAAALVWWARKSNIMAKLMPNSPVWPVEGHTRVSSPFGPRVAPLPGASTNHNGIDIPAPVGTLVLSPLPGVVNYIGTSSTGGKQMRIAHDTGAVSGYAHLQDYLVELGERVGRGEPVALVGNTGNSTGPHLHFTWRDSEQGPFVDPMKNYA